MPHQPGHTAPTKPTKPLYTAPKYAPEVAGSAGISGWGKAATPKFGLGTTEGIWKRRVPMPPGTTTSQTPIAAPYTLDQYNTAVNFLNQPPGAINPAMHPEGMAAGIRHINLQKTIKSAYGNWLANPYTTTTVPGDTAAEETQRVAARDTRLRARRAAGRGETTLYSYLSPDAFRKAMQRRFS